MASDRVCKLLIEYCEQGRPVMNNIPPCVQGYYSLSDRIVLDNGLQFLDDKLIVPESSWPGMLLTLHKGNFGMTKMKSKATQVFYWPRIVVCQKFAVSSPSEPLLSHERPSLPFNKIGTDIFAFGGKLYLV
ncbi:hypothetical protein PR048_031476 [Dryococelus australis]|uniref:Uncharacterized protein n=1 Tax=Dryococelus australis TaxID=614101 RepID=A0ABQ9G8E0_9NEOP|nr:hypothetical protein PR048_031476 [Dryococelus australis]